MIYYLSHLQIGKKDNDGILLLFNERNKTLKISNEKFDIYDGPMLSLEKTSHGMIEAKPELIFYRIFGAKEIIET